MFITGVRLKGFQRLVHNNIQEVSIDFTSPFQLVLGRNGSGKSSLMGELTPYPSHKDLYSDDGLRELYFNHRGSKYVVIDDFSLGKHSIFKDDELLHENLNPSMMKAVVKELFGIDKTLADILTDKKKFTTMSPAERREIIMRASGINIDLGIEILDKLKERRSYFKEYSKNLSKRLVAEDNNLPTDSHIEELNKRKEDILEDLKLLDELTHQQVEIMPERNMLDKINQFQQVGKIAYRFMDTPTILSKASDKEDAIEIGTKLRYDLEQIDIKKKAISEEIESLTISLGKNRFSKTKDDLTKELAFIDEELQALENESKGFIYVGEEFKMAVETAQSLYEDLREAFDRLPDNTNRYFNKETRNVNVENLIKINNRVSVLRNSIYEIEMGLKQHKDGELIECPACQNSFIPGVTLSETTLKERLEIQTKQLSLAEKELETAKEYEIEYKDYQSQLMDIDLYSKHFFLHGELFKRLRQYNYVANSPKHCLSILEDWFNDIGKSLRYNDLLIRREKVKEEISIVSAEDLERKRLEDERLQRLEKDYSHLIDEALRIKDKLKSIKEYLVYLTELNTWLKDAENLEQEVDDYKDNLLKNNLHKFVFTAKADLNRELSQIEKEITSIQYTLLNRERLGNDKVETDNSVDYLNILHDELSPKTGLLGDVMNEFIEKFVAQMNNFIKSIWTYDIKILPCRNKKGDLDFYFPVQIMGGKPSADVAEVSTGEQHICNFVFKLLIMATYDLQDFPLFLDELAGNMDDLHRVRIMKTVYDMVVNNYCTQMFLIAHYQQQYGVFTQAEVFVTNPDNLQSIPENYNSHAKFC